MSADSGTPRSKLITAAIVIRNLEEIPGYNGAILKIDDDEAERISNDIESAADYYEREAAALRSELEVSYDEDVMRSLYTTNLEHENESLRADRDALAAALRPFAKVTPSSLYAPDGSDGDTYHVHLSSRPSEYDFNGRDLFNAKQALAAHGGKP